MYNIDNITKKELADLIADNFSNPDKNILSHARNICDSIYGKRVFLRGLLEISNICKNNCYYCGIRRDNANINRYRLKKDDILKSCEIGYELGLRSFVLQGGEDAYYSDDLLTDIIYSLKSLYPDCAITLSLGERSYESYKRLYDSGTDRYLLRHETANAAHYSKIHPGKLSLEHRKKCLYDLREIGFQIGAGFMVGSPYQTFETLAEDILFLRDLKPHMVGIGPFVPHHDTIYKDFPSGTVEQTALMVALTRIILPDSLLPATTALSAISEHGRKFVLDSGANVVMPNISPQANRIDYAIYDNKPVTGLEASESLSQLVTSIKDAGYIPELSRGDHISFMDK